MLNKKVYKEKKFLFFIIINLLKSSINTDFHIAILEHKKSVVLWYFIITYCDDAIIMIIVFYVADDGLNRYSWFLFFFILLLEIYIHSRKWNWLRRTRPTLSINKDYVGGYLIRVVWCLYSKWFLILYFPLCPLESLYFSLCHKNFFALQTS